ncbi:MAG: hypothetical protein JXX14_20350, partial [Deltaproteobacteria bacterium]|nr:hypothetical protein [Deltaproteobacteria bacterium]
GKRDCGQYPGTWGTGECHAGEQTCQIQTGNDSAAWGTCSGEVWPTTEACGPMAPDADCDGIPGYNKGSCTDTIYITGYEESGNNPFNWCMDFDGTGGQTDLDAIDDAIDIFAGTTVPSGHAILATIKVFKQQHTGTVPIIRCRFGQNTNIYTYFVDYSESGQCYEESQTPDEDPVGYVSTVATSGYRRLRYLNLYSNRYPGTDMFAGTVPMGYSNCPNNCLCLDSNYYAVP